MLCNSALISSVFLTSVALADRSHELNRVERSNDAASDVVYNPYWSGAVWQMDHYTFNFITGTFTVPVPKGSKGSGAAAWVGIDQSRQCGSMLLAGVDFIVGDNDEPAYIAWYEWYPAYDQSFHDFPVSAGDDIHIAVTATSNTTGVILFENITKKHKHTVVQEVDSTHALCGTSAEWIVNDYTHYGKRVPFTDFGTVTFTGGAAYGPSDVNYEPGGATIWEIKQDGKVLTSTKTEGSSVTISHV